MDTQDLEQRIAWWARECELLADQQRARRIRADRHEPSPAAALPQEDPEQLTLPGLPAGFLAYQKNVR